MEGHYKTYTPHPLAFIWAMKYKPGYKIKD